MSSCSAGEVGGVLQPIDPGLTQVIEYTRRDLKNSNDKGHKLTSLCVKSAEINQFAIAGFMQSPRVTSFRLLGAGTGCIFVHLFHLSK